MKHRLIVIVHILIYKIEYFTIQQVLLARVRAAGFNFSQDGAEQISTILRTFGRGVPFARAEGVGWGGVGRGEDGWVATEGKL